MVRYKARISLSNVAAVFRVASLPNIFNSSSTTRLAVQACKVQVLLPVYANVDVSAVTCV